MNIGLIHSSGKRIIPFGNALLLRMMVEQWGSGFWSKWIGNVAQKLAEIYQDKRTYEQQILSAINEDIEELLICINSYSENVSKVKEMTAQISYDIRHEYGFQGNLIFTPPNEAPEHMSKAQYLQFLYQMRLGINEANIAQGTSYLSAGCQSAGDQSFYNFIFQNSGLIDYVDTHTSNDGDVNKIKWVVDSSPKPVIISEHYLWDIANKYSYDHNNAVNQNKILFDYYLRTPKIKSVYLLFPSLVSGTRYQNLAMSITDRNLDLIHKTRYYNQCVDYWNLINQEDDLKLELVKPGSKNEETRAIQQIINDEGAANPPLVEDGIYGIKTKNAVVWWQTENNLITDGVVGKQTWQWILENIEKGPLRFNQLLVRKGFQ